MTKESAIQVVFKPEEARKIRELAAMQHVSASAYVRGRILSQEAPVLVAWWCHAFDRDADSKMLQRNNGVGRMATHAHDFVLERLNQFANGVSEYKVFDPLPAPITYRAWQRTDWHNEGFDRGRIMVAGSHRLFKVIDSSADVRLGGQLRWLVAADPEIADR